MRRTAGGASPWRARPIDHPTCRIAKLSDEIDRIAIAVKPARAFPAGADQHISPLLNHDGDAFGLQIAAIGDADLALGDRDPIQRLALFLIGWLEMAKALVREVEGAVNAPQPVLLLGRRSGLRDRGRVDDPDQTAAARLRRCGGQRLPDQERQPIARPAQALKQRDIGNVGEPRGRRPSGGRSQPSIPKTIDEDQAQQIHRGCDHPRSQKGFRFTRALPKRRRPTKSGDDALPILVYK